MTFLTAVSSDGLVAVVHDASIGHSRLSIPLYQAGALQSTLACSITTSSDDDEHVVRKLVFVGSSHHLCALLEDRIVVWDVARGVAVHTIQGTFLDMATNNDDSLFGLLVKKNKLQVHEYRNAKCIRKIKCCTFKSGAVGLDVTSTLVVVRNANLVRVLALADGSRVGKCKLLQDTGSNGYTVAQGNLIATVTSTGLVLFDSNTQVQVGHAFLSQPVHRVELQQQHDGDYMILVDACPESALYRWTPSSNVDVPLKPTCPITSESALRVNFETMKQQQLVAVLHNNKSGIHVQQQVAWVGSDKLVLDIAQEEDITKEETPKNKRNKSITTTLGPGQAGGEASQVSDRSAKKRKTDMDESTIAERLQRLAKQVQDDDNDDQAAQIKADFSPKKATTESLEHLLRQALQSGDDSMLELSLTVRDRRVVELSLQGLEPELVSRLLTKLTTRLANKPNRATDLVLWVQLVLQSGKVRHVQQLRPLRNLLQERVESFSHLLQLEGRLSVLGASSLK